MNGCGERGSDLDLVIAAPDSYRAPKGRQVRALKQLAAFLLENDVCVVSGLRPNARVPILMLEPLP